MAVGQVIAIIDEKAPKPARWTSRAEMENELRERRSKGPESYGDSFGSTIHVVRMISEGERMDIQRQDIDFESYLEEREDQSSQPNTNGDLRRNSVGVKGSLGLLVIIAAVIGAIWILSGWL